MKAQIIVCITGLLINTAGKIILLILLITLERFHHSQYWKFYIFYLLFKWDHLSLVLQQSPVATKAGCFIVESVQANDWPCACRRTRQWCWRPWGPSRPNTQRCALRWQRSQPHRKSPWTPSGTTSAVSWGWSNTSRRLLTWRYTHKPYTRCLNTTLCTHIICWGNHCGSILKLLNVRQLFGRLSLQLWCPPDLDMNLFHTCTCND